MNPVAERLAAGEAVCPQCAARLAAGQEWCLECGAPVKIRVRSAPDWRAPLAIVVGVVALVAVGFVVVLVALSNTADRSGSSTPAAAAAPPSAKAFTEPKKAATQPQNPATTTPATTTPTTTLASWPAGVTGYTVVLGVIPSRAAATTSADKIAAAGIPTGVLNSSDYSSMRPGDWIVFSGTYTTRAQADVAATQLKTKGQPGAYAFSVVPAG